MDTEDKFKNSPIHDKRAIIRMLDELEPKEMMMVVEYIKLYIDSKHNKLI